MKTNEVIEIISKSFSLVADKFDAINDCECNHCSCQSDMPRALREVTHKLTALQESGLIGKSLDLLLPVTSRKVIDGIRNKLESRYRATVDLAGVKNMAIYDLLSINGVGDSTAKVIKDYVDNLSFELASELTVPEVIDAIGSK